MANFFTLIIFLLIASTVVFADSGHEPKESSRKQMFELLAKSGCTHKLVAHYVIQAAVSNLPATTMIQRIKEIALTYDTSKVTAW